MTIENMIDIYEATTDGIIEKSGDVYALETLYEVRFYTESEMKDFLVYQITEMVKANDFIAIDDISGERLTAEFIECSTARMAAYESDKVYIAM